MKTRYITLLLSSALALSASAQDLVKEIDVDRTIVPEEREATRPASPAPSIFTPQVKPVRLNSADRLAPSALTTLMTIPTTPATWGSTQPLTPYRGYVSGGYFPLYNLGITGGYQLISTPASQLGVWASYTGDSYKYDSRNYNNHFLGLGVNGSHSFSDKTALRGALTYRHDNFTMPFVADRKQGATIVDFNSAFLGKSTMLSYKITADVHHFGFADPLVSVSRIHGKAMNQTQVKIGGDAVFSFPTISFFRPGASVSYDALMTNNIATAGTDGLTTKDGTYGILRVDPYALFTTGEFEGKVGVNISIGTAQQSCVRFAPNVSLAYKPAKMPFNVWATLEGGMGQNRIYDLYERDYTCTPPLAMKSYNIPFALRGGINAGPFYGVRASVHVGYATARDLAIPWLITPVVPGMTTARKLDGLNAGIDLTYTHPLFTVRAGFEAATTSQTDPNKGWYLWRDRAKSAFTMAADVRPIEKLTVTVSYMGRYGRHTFAGRADAASPWLKVDTGSISNLNLGGRYVYTPQLSFFANIENILNHRYLFSSTVPAQGITGLIGAEYKF